MLIDTPEKRQKRQDHFERQSISSLLERYKEAAKEGNWAKADKIAWMLSAFRIEGDKSYAVGTPQE